MDQLQEWAFDAGRSVRQRAYLTFLATTRIQDCRSALLAARWISVSVGQAGAESTCASEDGPVDGRPLCAAVPGTAFECNS
jgi:hypothetical protein